MFAVRRTAGSNLADFSLQKLNSAQTSAGPVKVDKNSKNAAANSAGVSRSPLLSEGGDCVSVLRSSARLPAGNGRRTTTPRG